MEFVRNLQPLFAMKTRLSSLLLYMTTPIPTTTLFTTSTLTSMDVTVVLEITILMELPLATMMSAWSLPT